MGHSVIYDPTLVILSVFVAIFASYVALNLGHSVTHSRGRGQLAWLSGGALALGIGIWSMHFTGMLAFEMPGMEMAYDLPLMILSIVVAILGSALALYVISRPKVTFDSIAISGVMMAVAIAGMHYIGMYSMRMQARIEWNYYLVALSILIALVASFAALKILISLRNKPDRVMQMSLASVLMGVAISGMHYTGMLAATFIHDHSLAIQGRHILVTSGLAVATVATTMMVLVLALAGSIGQRVIVARQKRNEEILGKSEEKFRRLVDAVKDYAILMLDPDGNITTWNSGAQRITGYAASEIIGKHMSTLYTELDAHSDLASRELLVARELGHFECEALRVKKDGSRYWAHIVLDPLYDRGRLTGYSKVIRDVTQLRAINEELERRVQERTVELEQLAAQLKAAKEEAEIANETKSSFLANMSHEIRTPLGAIIGFSELMSNNELPQEERANAADVIKRNGKVLSTIINDILDLSKVEAGKLEVESTTLVLNELLEDLGTLLGLDASAKGISFEIEKVGGLPSVLTTDPVRLRQILFNVIGNAIKFTEKGGVKLTVRVSPKDPAKLQFVVKDTGHGITEEQRERLFSPFSQGDATTTRKFGGTGLGLVLSKKLAGALRGDVLLLDSERGKGSTFSIEISHGQDPRSLPLPHPAESALAKPSTPEKLKELNDRKILVVDDSPDNLMLIGRMLSLAGAEVDTASNGREGVHKAMGGDFSMVLMDLQMPEMDGYQAVKELRAQGFDRPVIALTAHAMKEERKRCLDSGFDNHLTKPVDRAALINTLASYEAR